jgi:hypothetical protein
MQERDDGRNRRRIEDRLRRLIGDGAAAFYHDAIQIQVSETLIARGHLLGHLSREIDSALLQAMTPLVGPPPPRSCTGQDNRRQRATEIATVLGLPLDDEVVARWTSNRFDRAAHRNNLAAPRAVDHVEWEAYEGFLRVALDRVEAEYDLVLTGLDALLRENPGNGDARLLCSLPPGPQSAALRYFFDRASAAWVHAIPACVRETLPVAVFLARVAPELPEQVGRLVEQIALAQPVEPALHGELAVAASRLPGSLAARWALAESDWVGAQPWLAPAHPFRYANALGTLLDHDESEAALTLTGALLALGERVGDFGRDLAIRMSPYGYQDLLETVVPRLIETQAHNTLAMLLPLLARGAAEAEGDAHLSGMWLHAVSDHPQDERPTPLKVLARRVRDAAVTAAASGIGPVLDSLTAHAGASNIFGRLGLHVIARRHDVALAVTWLEDPSLHHYDFAREAYELVFALRNRFSVADRERVYAAMTAANYGESTKQAIASLLDPARATDAERLDERVGLLFWLYGPTRPRSPFTAEQFNTLRVSEAVDLARTWGPDDEFERADIAPVVQAAVTADPARYIESAPELMRLPAHCMSLALYAFSEAAKEGRVEAWTPLLEALLPAVTSTWSGDDWASTRASLASFVLTLAARPPTHATVRDRELVWALIRSLASEPPTGLDRELARDNEGLLGLMLDETRPKAIHAAMYFWRWASAGNLSTAGAEAFLDAHADPAREQSLAVRAAFGYELPLLLALDPDWVNSRLELLFPAGEGTSHYRRAVWDAYVNSPHHQGSDTFGALRPQWLRWADDLGEPLRDTDERAAEIVLVHYWHGNVTLDDRIMDRLFEAGPAALRGELMRWLGWQIWLARDEPPDHEIACRLHALWVRRSEAANVTAPELASFGRWFAGSMLEVEWATDELERLVQSDVPISDLDEVMDSLVQRAAVAPARAGRIAELLVAGETDQERLMLAEEAILSLTEALEASGDDAARAAARAIRNRMRSRGFRSFHADQPPEAPRERPRRRRRPRQDAG